MSRTVLFSEKCSIVSEKHILRVNLAIYKVKLSGCFPQMYFKLLINLFLTAYVFIQQKMTNYISGVNFIALCVFLNFGILCLWRLKKWDFNFIILQKIYLITYVDFLINEIEENSMDGIQGIGISCYLNTHTRMYGPLISISTHTSV